MQFHLLVKTLLLGASLTCLSASAADRLDDEIPDFISLFLEEHSEEIDALKKPEITCKLAENEDQIIGTEDYLGNLEQQEADAQARGEAIGNALVSGLSLAMAAITTQDNPIISFLSVLGPQILSMMPSIVTAISTAGSMMTAAFWTSTAGIGIIVSAIVATLAAIGTAIKSAYDEKQSKKFENQIDNLNDKEIW